MDSVDYQRLLHAFSIDSPAKDGGLPDEAGDAWILADIDKAFAGKEQTKTVLGVDIYQYSSYEPDQQRVIPVLFRHLYELALQICESNEAFLFHRQDLKSRFIPTGDGGFQLLDTPLHGVVFAMQLQALIEAFNGFLIYARLRRMLGPLRVRYALTNGSLFRLDANYFGAAIINNARILSRDKLNRFLVDAASVSWFQTAFGSLESLLLVTREDLERLSQFSDYPKTGLTHNLFPEAKMYEKWHALRVVTLQHVGHVGVKRSQFDVYNLYIQFRIANHAIDGRAERAVIVSVGNLNASGIAE